MTVTVTEVDVANWESMDGFFGVVSCIHCYCAEVGPEPERCRVTKTVWKLKVAKQCCKCQDIRLGFRL